MFGQKLEESRKGSKISVEQGLQSQRRVIQWLLGDIRDAESQRLLGKLEQSQ